jgi:hypothetical protein
MNAEFVQFLDNECEGIEVLVSVFNRCNDMYQEINQ